MKEQFTIFSNRLTINDQEISHVSSRVDLLEESRSEIELGIVRIKKSESKMELGTQGMYLIIVLCLVQT